MDARARPEGLSLRLSLDADLLLRLVADTGGPSLQLAGVAPRDAPSLSWRRHHRLGLVMTLLALAVALGSLLWLPAPAREHVSETPPPFTLPELPSVTQPSALTPPATLQPSPPPAPPVIRLEPTPEAPAPPLPLPQPSVVPRPRASPAPAAVKPATPLPSPKRAVERPATSPPDVLELFDDTK